MKKFLVFSVLSWLVQWPLYALCVKENYANLRSGPGIHHDQTWQVTRYTPLKKLGKKNGWYHIEDVDHRKHWIREDLVTSSFSCAVIKEEYSNLRKGPGATYPQTKAGRGDKYLAFRVLAEKSGWVKVEDMEGDELWITKLNVWIQ